MHSGANTVSSGRGSRRSREPRFSKWATPLLIFCFLAVISIVAGGSLARAGSGAQTDTETSLSTSRQLVPFAYTVRLTAHVNAVRPGRDRVAGTVQFRVDGVDFGPPVPVAGGIAATRLSGLSPGDHDVIALFKSSAGFSPSEASLVQSVDSPPPGPAGILPCANRRLVLTAAYRRNHRIQFEGVARYSLRGETVHIRTGGHSVASTEVRADGTFWTASAAPAGSFRGRTEFRALANGHSSWARRLAQAVEIRERTPHGAMRTGPSPSIEAKIRKGGMHRVVLARQVGCRKQKVVPVRQVGSEPDGRFRIRMPRPGKGKPYQIYRLRIGSGGRVSSPIVVRPAS